MVIDTVTIVLYSVNLVYITTCLYGGLLKSFYVPDAYKEVFGELYPAHNTLANIYLMQVLELPFVFTIYKPEVLFCVNGASMMFIISYMVVLIKGYFFLDFVPPKKLFVFQLPAFLCWLGLLLPVFGIIEFTPVFKTIASVVVMIVVLWYIYLLDRCRLRLVGSIREIDENEYSNDSDFPVKFAKSIQYHPLVICLVLIANFLINAPIAKIVRDVILILMNVWLAINTLNPHRNSKKLPQDLKKKDDAEASEIPAKYRLTEKYCRETEQKLVEIIRAKSLYLEEHITMNDLIDIMHINRNYLSEVIARSKYQSFYKLINTMRIEHACDMLKTDSTAKLEQIAISSGFSSGSAFSQVFKRIMDVSPKEYILRIHAE